VKTISVAFLLLASSLSLCQTVKTTGYCSPTVTDSHNVTIYIVCLPKDRKGLKARTISLAVQILEFVDARQGPMTSLSNEVIAATFENAIIGQKSQEALRSEIENKIRMWQTQTRDLFLSEYWNSQVLPLLAELRDAHVDTYPVTKASAAGDIRRIALMLSVVAERIGKKGPTRILTNLEAAAILKEAMAVAPPPYSQFEFSADKRDPDSIRIAETLRRTFATKWTKTGPVTLLDRGEYVNPNDRPHHSVHIIFPSADWTQNFAGLIELFSSSCDLETKVDVRGARQPPSIIKIEVWPESAFHSDKGLLPVLP
jgi:hypothetical protein